MSVTTTVPKRTTDRSHDLLFAGVLAEFLVAFGVLVFFLAWGTAVMPLFVLGALMADGTDVRGNYALPAVMIVLGWCGLVGIQRVLYLVCWRKPYDQHARLTLSGVGAGVVLVLAWAVWDCRYGLSSAEGAAIIYWLPLASTAHFIYLARGALFGKPSA